MGRAADEQRRAAAARGAAATISSPMAGSSMSAADSAGTFPWAHADLRVDGAEFKDVGLRYKGNSASRTSSAAAPLFANFKLKIDVYGTKGIVGRREDVQPARGRRGHVAHAGGDRVCDLPRRRRARAAHGVRRALLHRAGRVPGHVRPGSSRSSRTSTSSSSNARCRPARGLLMKPEGLRGGVQTCGETLGVVRPDAAAGPRRDAARAAARDRVRAADLADRRRALPREDRHVPRRGRVPALPRRQRVHRQQGQLPRRRPQFLSLSRPEGRQVPVHSVGPGSVDGHAADRQRSAASTSCSRYRGDQPLIYWLLDDPAVAAQYRAIVRELAATVFSSPSCSRSSTTSNGSAPRAAPRRDRSSRAASPTSSNS